MPAPDFALSLRPHPLTPAPMVRSLDVAIARTAHGLNITYRPYGDMARLLFPVGTTDERCDNLWEHTCFELFVACTGCTAYREFNFSPAGQWAAYDFTDYRTPTTAAVCVPVPHIAARRSDGCFDMDVHLALEALPSTNLGSNTLDIGLSAVIESADTPDGPRSYWALYHPVERPDFHHRDGFVLSLPFAH